MSLENEAPSRQGEGLPTLSGDGLNRTHEARQRSARR